MRTLTVAHTGESASSYVLTATILLSSSITAKSRRLNQNWYRPEPEWNRSESECVYRSVSVQMGNDMYQSVGFFLYQSDTILIQSVFSLYQR